MSAPTGVPDLAIGSVEEQLPKFEQAIGAASEPGKEEELDAALGACIALSGFLQSMFKMSRQSTERELRRGVDAKAFAAKYQKVVDGLDHGLLMVSRIVANVQNGRPSAPRQQFIANFKSLSEEMAALRQYLAEAVSKAKTPARAIDWQRVQEAEAAYARGETKAYQRKVKPDAAR